jgi:hypothetical protein
MVYYEGWRKDETTGIVTNVGYCTKKKYSLFGLYLSSCYCFFLPVRSSLKIVEDSIPIPKDTVRSHLKLHFKRGTPVDGGKSCMFSFVYNVDLTM